MGLIEVGKGFRPRQMMAAAVMAVAMLGVGVLGDKHCRDLPCS